VRVKYVIYGAGAIGGSIGARMHLAGHEVILIARGQHLAAIKHYGLRFLAPEEDHHLRIPAVEHPSEILFHPEDVVFLCMKGQDTAAALTALADAAGTEIGVVTCQNGVDNERMALRMFPGTYAMVVMMPASHLEAGVVRAESAPVTGILDAGCYPGGVDVRIEAVCADLERSTFSARPDPEVMRQKYTKLLMNLGNAVAAAVGPTGQAGELTRRARAEAVACYQAAGIDYMSDEEFRGRRGNLISVRPIRGEQRGGGSSWQSLVRGTGSIEADCLNGEICLLGRIHGIPTPVNRLLQETANRLARERAQPGCVTEEELLARLGD
jgi:2-dehydropantoate 2-reductase